MAVSPMSVSNPAPGGLVATYIGAGNLGGSTTRYYWVQGIYPSGKGPLQRSNALASMPSSLDRNNFVYIEWNPSALALGYNVYYTTSTTAPTIGPSLIGTVTAPNFTDQGQSNTANLQTGLVVIDGLQLARARYDFAIDGGGAPGLITLAQSDTIPAGAIMVGGTLNPTTALVGSTTTIAVGTSAGSAANSIKTATAEATYSIDAVLNIVPVFATPVKMSAAGTITITTATAALTAGKMDIFVLYYCAVSL